MVVGSLPRPQWIRELIEDRKAGRIESEQAAGLLDSAIPSAILMQERAGMDFVSDGEWRRESYVKVFADAVEGFQADLIGSGGPRASHLMYPAVVARLGRARPIALDEARFLRSHCGGQIIVAIPSPYTIGQRMWSPEHSASAYPTREEFMEACIPIIREEVRGLIDIGVDAIQLDDPWLALLVDPEYRRREGITDIEHEVRLSARCVNGVVEGMEGAFISVHLCHAHFNRRHGTRGPYDPIIDALGGVQGGPVRNGVRDTRCRRESRS